MPASQLTRFTDFIPDDLIRSADVDTELNQLVQRSNLLHRTIGGSVVQVQTDANTTEKDLHTFTIPANTFAANQDRVCFEISVFFAGNGNTKRVRLYFNNVVFGDTTAVGFNGTYLVGKAELVRINTTDIRAVLLASVPGNAGVTAAPAYLQTNSQLYTGLTFSGTLPFKVTGQNGTAQAGDIIQISTVVDFKPA